MNFAVYFILPMLLVTMCKKPHSKIVHGSLAILRGLSTSKITKIHPLRTLESCFSFFWECSLVNLASYIIWPMFLVITCKRPHSKIPHRFLTVLKCLTACQLKMTMKYEFSSNFPLTWSLKFGCLFQVIWYFAMKPFVKHYLEDYRIGKIPPDSMSYTLGQKKRMIWKNTKLALIAMGFQQFYEFQNTTYPWTFQDIGRTIWHFWMGFFATCFKFAWSNVTPPGSLDLDPGSQGKPVNSWCISFETECTWIV